MIHIFYAEDDGGIAQAVKEYLEGQGCAVTIFVTIGDMKRHMLCGHPDVVLVDWNMPDGQGDDFCRWLRTRWTELPIIFLTVRGDSPDIVSGFQSGADDYVVKPFAPDVLYSRILALLRRAGQVQETVFHCDALTLDTGRMTAFRNQEEIVLSQPEYQVLSLLMTNKGKTVTRRQLLEQVWDSSGNYVNDNTLTVTVKRLREKLGNPACLKTVRSFGYRMEDTL